ncbi:juvenile hormone epoxide hydrolase 1 [Drosophila grimshawi]|uniref:Epoxide hydrolase n=1 Tax=Drosophila grimshawi TaxID=7222 RepID=B4J4K1_DROGR|nr:juvenile hormone epoxide hydrolase 1 [Drosophila grimshawi]EDW02706.1 GH19729 [Drosophila grimshawi]
MPSVASTFVRILIGGLALLVAVGYKNYRDLGAPGKRPDLDNNAYWGPKLEGSYQEKKEISPYDISVAPEVIADLTAQLERPLKVQEPLEGIGFEYGFNAKELQRVVKYWRDSYLPKWNEREQFLKKLKHFQTEIQGLKIHFIHAKPKKAGGKKVVPLLLMHGWPGTVREFYDFIPLLTTGSDKSDYVFEVIAPSLPGYGWSQGAARPGLGVAQVSVVMRNLMLRLGFDKFLIQGGDWGSIIGSNLASLFPENVIGYHSNMCSNNSPMGSLRLLFSSFLPSFYIDSQYKEYYKGVSKMFLILMEEMGYAHIQATKPDTIGTALAHNPVGLAAYILEKFSTWTNPTYINLEDGGLTKHFNYDQLLDNVMIYYVTNSITTSQRLYAESMGSTQMALGVDSVPVKAPAGCTRFANEIFHVPDSVLANKFPNLVHSTHYPEGGHFPAFQVPQQLYEDYVAYVKKALG